MDRDTIKEVVRDVFGPNYMMRDLGEWVSMPCPLAPWTHEKGADSSPSFGIHCSDNDVSLVNCFTCGCKMPFHAMLKKYAGYSGQDLSSVVKEVEREEFLGPRVLSDWDSVKTQRMKDLLMPVDDAIFMDIYPSAENHPYVKRRGISPATARKIELRYDPGDTSYDREKRILFPVRGADGLLYGFSGRAISGRAVLKVKDYLGLKKAYCILGAHLVAQDSRDFALVAEGLFDYARLQEMGLPGCSVMHSTLTDHQADVLRDIGKKLYDFYDNDQAGRKGAEVMHKTMAGYVTTMTTKYPRVWIEDDDGGHWLGDPGEMTREEADYMIRTATMRIDEKFDKRYSRKWAGKQR